MLSLSVESHLSKAGKSLLKEMDERVEKAQKEAAKVIQTEARRRHRYTRRSGTLERAVQSEIVRDIAKVYVSDAMAPYAQSIHDGFRTWSADPFLYEALKRKESDIKKLVDKAVSEAIKKTGFSR